MRPAGLGLLLVAAGLLLAGCASGNDQPDPTALAVIAADDNHPIAPMSQAAVDEALQAPELAAAVDYRAQHKYDAMVTAFRTAAAQGNAIAQLQLAQLYHRGAVVSQDDDLADYWLHQAAEQGLGEAQVTLAESYFAGDGQWRNAARGWRWLRAAEAQERPAIWAMIGEVYLAGVAPVPAQAPQSPAELMAPARRERDTVAALHYFHRAAAAGDENGALALCLYYMQGPGYIKGGAGTTRSVKDGQPWCDQAAARGNMAARKYTTVSSRLPEALPQPDDPVATVLGYIGQGTLVLIYVGLSILADANLHISIG
ncbi:MAG TPA: tetratricopeptide repeat protein [Terriglobales bacterium]|nr:tetratricopeptide repeat protein [Terriglobales bacterium]